MLVLTRRLGEKIVINNNVIVTLVEVRGDKIRLGIEAPPDFPVYRQEVWEQIHKGPEKDPFLPESHEPTEPV